MAKGDPLHNRLTDFAAKIINLCDTLPETKSGKHIAAQLLRCGTAPAFTYEGIKADASADDTASQLGAILKDLTKVATWLEMLRRSKMLISDIVPPIAKECAGLVKNIDSGISAATQNNGGDEKIFEEDYAPPWREQETGYEIVAQANEDGRPENGA
jgi:four helix bundle protein